MRERGSIPFLLVFSSSELFHMWSTSLNDLWSDSLTLPPFGLSPDIKFLMEQLLSWLQTQDAKTVVMQT